MTTRFRPGAGRRTPLRHGARATIAWLALLSLALAQPGCRDSRALPTTAAGPAGERLRQWWGEGTAAGNVGDWYDNRDGGHSDLDTSQWPQLRRVAYTRDDRRQHRDWGVQTAILPQPVIGNSSTAFNAPGGSNPMYYYLGWRGGLAFLSRQYRANNLYVYPAHRDYAPGHNGMPAGYGDLYPTNTPYLVISRGASGSDQPFVRAFTSVLAAFRRDVKPLLIAHGLLMPTLQWLLRTTQRTLAAPGDYFTGIAHPTVFDAAALDELAMVEIAHALTPDLVPPLVNLEVLEEDPTTEGIDYFDPGLTERLGDSPGAIARVWRARRSTQRLVISARASVDLGNRPLSFRWVVLRGDESTITITPRDPDASVAELVVGWPARRPIAAQSTVASNRVDIGVFAGNGSTYSAPAFVTFVSLDNETRTYADDGRLLDIVYHRGNFTDPRLTFAKEWRDVFRYDAKRRCLGWLRLGAGTPADFNWDGRLVLARDGGGRPTEARNVRYEQPPFAGEGTNPHPLRFVPEREVVHYAYADDDDVIGRAAIQPR